MRKFLASLLVLGSVAATAAETAAPASGGMIPLKDFARFSDYIDVTISPTGEYIGATVYLEGQVALAIIRLSDMKLTGSLRYVNGQSVSDYWWVGPERVVATIGDDYGTFIAPFLTGELMGANADGSNIKPLVTWRDRGGSFGTKLVRTPPVNGAAWMVDPLPDHADKALVSISLWEELERYGDAVQTVHEMDTTHGVLRKVSTSPFRGPADFLADRSGFVRYVTGMDQKGAVLTYSRTPDAPDWKQLASGRITDPMIEPLAFSRDNSIVYLRSNVETGRDCLYAHEVATDQRKPLACDTKAELDDVIFAFDGSRPIGVTYVGTQGAFRPLDETDPDAKLLGAVLRSFPGQIVEAVSRTNDGSKLILLAYSDRNPGDFYLFDTTTRKAKYLLSRNSWIDPKLQAEVRPISFTARSGVQLEGFLTLPAGREAKKLPMVVMPHGGPIGVRDEWGWDAEAQMLASRGYAVLQVNYSGSGGTGLASRRAAKGAWGTRMIDDITDGTRWAVEQGIGDPNRLCIFGGSYGGYAALMSAVREPDLYKCSIGYAGAYDLVALRDDSRNFAHEGDASYFSEMVGADEKTLIDQSPITHLDKLKAAVMIAHGGMDKICPISQATALRSALEKRKRPYVWLEKGSEVHGFYKPENRVELYEKMLAFLAANIGDASGAPQAASP